MVAPIVPYLSEELYQNLTGEYSVHTADFPVYNESLINETIEEKMDLVRDLISIGRNVREDVKIKVREPLSEALLDGKTENIIGDLKDLIKEELNVKNVVFVKDLSEYMNFNVKPNFKEVGKVFGPKIRLFQEELTKLSSDDINKLRNEETIIMNIDGNDTEVNLSMVDVRIEEKEGFNVGMENNNFVILNTERTKELIQEGLAREFVSKVQNIRKQKDFNVVDRIKIYFSGDQEFDEAIDMFEEYIKNETLAIEFVNEKTSEESYNLNDHEVYIEIEKS